MLYNYLDLLLGYLAQHFSKRILDYAEGGVETPSFLIVFLAAQPGLLAQLLEGDPTISWLNYEGCYVPFIEQWLSSGLDLLEGSPISTEEHRSSDGNHRVLVHHCSSPPIAHFGQLASWWFQLSSICE